jgi:hypothetical protein
MLALTAVVTARAQAPDSTPLDTAVADTFAAGVTPTAPVPEDAPLPPAPPPPPTPDQERYLQGLQRVARGIAQLRVALDQLSRSQATRDSVSQRRASRRLGGYCQSAASFMRGGRANMRATAYDDSARVTARRLVATVDELIRYAPTCETEAGAETTRVAAAVEKLLQAYDTALVRFRSATGLSSGRELAPPP